MLRNYSNKEHFKALSTIMACVNPAQAIYIINLLQHNAIEKVFHI